MAVGLPRTRGDIDNRIGTIALNLRATMTDIDRFAELLAGLGPSGLAALGYEPADIALLQQVITDMTDLVAIARAEKTQPEARDFTQAARLVMGAL
jgi:hypothetical protein